MNHPEAEPSEYRLHKALLGNYFSDASIGEFFRLNQANEDKKIVLFTDAAHFVHGAFMSYVWCFARVFIGTPPGGKPYNVLGAINAVTTKLTMVTNDSYINAKSVCLLLKKLSLQYLEQSIILVLDNARYQKCRLVRRYAKKLGIQWLYLPSYSPQLNIIESRRLSGLKYLMPVFVLQQLPKVFRDYFSTDFQFGQIILFPQTVSTYNSSTPIRRAFNLSCISALAVSIITGWV